MASLKDILKNILNSNPNVIAGKKIYNTIKSVSNYLTENNTKPIVIDLSDKKLVNASKNKANNILSNEFIEYNNNTIRKAKDFKHTTDTLLGDRKIPMSKISQFYGIENGKLKVDSLQNFNDTTTIIPVRNKNVGKIKKVINHGYQAPDYSKLAYKKYPEISFLQGLGYMFTLRSNELIKRATDRRNYYNQLIDDNYPTTDSIDIRKLKGITENNDTIELPYGFLNKGMFSDEKGNAIFTNNLKNDSILNKVNTLLHKTPRYPILLDNGRYRHYILNNNNARNEYPNPLNNINNMYTIGY